MTSRITGMPYSGGATAWLLDGRFKTREDDRDRDRPAGHPRGAGAVVATRATIVATIANVAKAASAHSQRKKCSGNPKKPSGAWADVNSATSKAPDTSTTSRPRRRSRRRRASSAQRTSNPASTANVTSDAADDGRSGVAWMAPGVSSQPSWNDDRNQNGGSVATVATRRGASAYPTAGSSESPALDTSRAEVAGTVAEELVGQRLRPRERDDHRRDRADPRDAAPGHPGLGSGAPLRPEEPGDRERQQHGDEERVAEVGLEDQAPGRDQDREEDDVAGRDAPREEQRAPERQQHAVRVPRVEQHLAAERPREHRRDRHGDGDEQRPGDAVHDPRDAEHASTLSAPMPSATPGPLNDRDGDREQVEEEGTGVMEVDAGALRRRRREPDERRVLAEDVVGADLEQHVLADRRPRRAAAPVRWRRRSV